ncbi:glycosyltransferase family 2 protein [Georgenia faecalis]|uniref:glycosyltransferase family 2 protein n=1 Tax=Georgenia faecalis TaxID=2483799 RepID=UPI0013DEF44A|nr:glycosyltransferase family A protein [Georgenia faecalis]
MDEAPVTVVIPYFDASGTIGRALDSVGAQTRPPAEVVVVDDGSSAPERRALRSILLTHRRVRLLELPGNGGPSVARNAGWDAATQPFVAFLDADDSWHPRKLERQLTVFAAQPEAALVAHGGTVAPDGEAPGAGPAPLLQHPRVRRVRTRDLLLRNQFGTPAVMVRRDVAARFDPTLRYAEDRDLWLRLLVADAPVLLADEALAVYHKPLYGAGGLSGRLWAMERGELTVYRRLRARGDLSAVLFVVATTVSVVKFVRRLVVVAVRRLRGPR